MIESVNQKAPNSKFSRQLKRNASPLKWMKILFLAILASVANGQTCGVEIPETNEVNAVS